MSIRLYYETGRGEMIDLDRYPYKLETGDLPDYEWSYTTANSRITGFYRALQKKDITIHILGRTAAEYAQNWKTLHDAFARDLADLTPGKLHFNSCYLTGYIYSDTVDGWTRPVLHTKNAFKLVCEDPVWVTERTVHVNGAGVQDKGKTYSYTYPYTYGRRSMDVLTIDNYTASAFRIIAFGPFSEFALTVGPNFYGVRHSAAAGEYLVIDSRKSTAVGQSCYVVGTSGAKINVFDDRDPDHELFAKIPVGENQISYTGTGGLDLTVYMERSTPLWT
jgi:hypothetical protein